MTSDRWAIGIDIGGTKIAAGLLHAESGEAVAQRSLPTRPERGGAAILAAVAAIADHLAGEARARGKAVGSLGVGVPEIVDPNGQITSDHVFDWRTLPVADRLDAIAPATIAADVRAAALAEARLGAGRPFASFVYVSIGTGISSTLVLDGKPLTGARGAALVLSSGPLSLPCSRCGAIEPFVLEEYASGPALACRYREQSGHEVSTAEAVLSAARAGDTVAMDIVASAATALGSAIGWLVNAMDPEAVILGGGLGAAPGPYWDTLNAATRRAIWNPAARSLPILPARLGSDAGWIGAALTASERSDMTDCGSVLNRPPILVAAGRR